jgi:ABC-type lipoprotein export system ATPase subunit
MVTHDPHLAHQAKRNIFVRDGRVSEGMAEEATVAKIAV